MDIGLSQMAEAIELFRDREGSFKVRPRLKEENSTESVHRSRALAIKKDIGSYKLVTGHELD